MFPDRRNDFLCGHGAKWGLAPRDTTESRMPTSATIETLPVIDTAHLDRVTFRDAAFRVEILTLFIREARALEQRLTSAATDEDWRVAAHTLKGMSRGVGAAQLASLS